jgi:hypothetical protein
MTRLNIALIALLCKYLHEIFSPVGGVLSLIPNIIVKTIVIVDNVDLLL